MEILSDVNLVELGFVGLMSFGSVGVIGFFLQGRFNKKLTSEQKFVLLVIFAFCYSFVPADLGNAVADRLKDALAVATALTAAYTGLKKLSPPV